MKFIPTEIKNKIDVELEPSDLENLYQKSFVHIVKDIITEVESTQNCYVNSIRFPAFNLFGVKILGPEDPQHWIEINPRKEIIDWNMEEI